MLEACPPAAWREICARAVADAQNGNIKAREWLGRHLVGDPAFDAPRPVVALAKLIAGTDPLVEQIAQPIIQREISAAMLPQLGGDEATAARIRAEIEEELDRLNDPDRT